MKFPPSPDQEDPDEPTRGASALPSKRRLIELVALHTCTRNCFGVADHAAGCCKLDDRDWIQGPVTDTEDVLRRLSLLFERSVEFDELFIGAEEGATLFPERSTWQDPANFPAIRPIRHAASGYQCRFLGENGQCGIYEQRPSLCRDYQCDHLRNVIGSL